VKSVQTALVWQRIRQHKFAVAGNATNLLICAAAWMRQKDSPLSDPAVWISDPVSRDNDRWIALNWMVHGEGSSNGIWRVNPDGSDAVSLTSKEFGDLWGCSPDGK